ncbi:hypothetical protein A1O1_03013 [Capronia coronata CBS 617.96]|uniref:Uncharacterized protein n=1 Tax=Capronia coronata CBS 617.96 TaxID=1182541 RepID=W9YNV1_9EURO|nr:uncharacterized protein A1O1_03013 [Capronia coronata CBS 617.96]EXJ94617.1 hypothetical protein A1O1_03013 [Capronia coronata CBS 617.96]
MASLDAGRVSSVGAAATTRRGEAEKSGASYVTANEILLGLGLVGPDLDEFGFPRELFPTTNASYPPVWIRAVSHAPTSKFLYAQGSCHMPVLMPDQSLSSSNATYARSMTPDEMTMQEQSMHASSPTLPHEEASHLSWKYHHRQGDDRGNGHQPYMDVDVCSDTGPCLVSCSSHSSSDFRVPWEDDMQAFSNPTISPSENHPISQPLLCDGYLLHWPETLAAAQQSVTTVQ